MDLSAPFDRASDRLKLIASSHGFRLASVGREGGKQGHGFAEFSGTGLRLRLVWEGKERVLWVEAARQAGTQVVSRWVDVEWSIAGERLPLNRDTSAERIEQLASAVDAYLGRVDWQHPRSPEPLCWPAPALRSDS